MTGGSEAMTDQASSEAIDRAGDLIAGVKAQQGAFAVILASDDPGRRFGVTLLAAPAGAQPCYAATLGAALAGAFADRAERIRAAAEEDRLRAEFEAFRLSRQAA